MPERKVLGFGWLLRCKYGNPCGHLKRSKTKLKRRSEEEELIAITLTNHLDVILDTKLITEKNAVRSFILQKSIVATDITRL